jgi:DNA-binding HxlR family transcriptional regulator
MRRDTFKRIQAEKRDEIKSQMARIRPGYAIHKREEREVFYRQYSGEEERSGQLGITLIQGKWKVGILSSLKRGPVRLSQLRRMFPQASKKTLGQHLHEIEKDGFIIRTDLDGRLRHMEYSLSDSCGFAVLPVVNTLTEWGARDASLLPKPEAIHSASGPRRAASHLLGG